MLWKAVCFWFFSPAECGRWSQAQSDTAIKQHLVEMGWSLLHLWPSGLSVCMDVRMHVCVCPTASRSVGTPWPVRSMVPTWILCEMRQKSRKTHQLEDAKEGRRRFRQLWNIFRLHSQNCLYFKSLLCPSILQEAFVTLGCFVFCVVFFSYYILVRIGDEQTYHTSDVRWDKAEIF